MLVKYKKPNALSVHMPGKARSTESFTFVPGYNEVPDDLWKRMEGHGGVKPLLQSRDLVARKPSRDNKKAGIGLAPFDMEEAQEIIDETYGKKILTSWKTSEKRQVIVTAIDKQIKRVDESVGLRDPESDGEYGPNYN